MAACFAKKGGQQDAGKTLEVMRIATVILLLLFIGCKTPLKVTNSQKLEVTDKTQVATTLKQKSKQEVEVSTLKTIEKTENVVTTTKTTEYDTEKPINPTTGKPPVKSETETTQTVSSNKITQENTTVAASDTTTIEKTDSSKKNVTIEAEQEHSEKKQLPNILWWAVSIIGVGILALVFWKNIAGWINRLF